MVWPPLVRAANWPEHPILHAVRVTIPPKIDGDLSDPAWQSAPEFTDFTQHDPDDGKPPTMRTSIRIVYDDKAIYFGARMDDPQTPTALLVRRDQFVQSDFLSINIDSAHDRLSGLKAPGRPRGPPSIWHPRGRSPVGRPLIPISDPPRPLALSFPVLCWKKQIN